MKYSVTVLPGEHLLSAPEDSSLLEVLQKADLAPDAPCGGQGSCKKCKVLVDGTEQLACQTRVRRDMVVTLFDADRVSVLAEHSGDVPVADPEHGGLLLAVDIGTTTVAAWLLDGGSGKELAVVSNLNPQTVFGADVITRLQLARDGKLEAQKSAIVKELNGMVGTLCKSAGVSAEEIRRACVVGNPAMQQLFLGLDVNNLLTIPFGPVLVKPMTAPAGEHLSSCPNAELQTVPDISGYVGADIVAGILATDLTHASDNVLFVDIGTNGEMVLRAKDGRMTACSTAAGPALEGAKIRFGMRGAPGAIDHVTQEDGNVVCHVIGDGPAKGICGSGLIDAVAVFLERGDINKRGRIQDPAERDGERFLPLTENVWLTQNDIREVMLAKGAIAAGIELMAEELGLTLDDIDRVLLAGAFGSFMDAHSACRIGLLPAALDGKITAVGNTAGSGARQMVCDPGLFEATDILIQGIDFLELGDLPSFRKSFAKNMNFTE